MKLDILEQRNNGKICYSDLLKDITLDFNLDKGSGHKRKRRKEFIARVSFSTLEVVDLFCSYDDNPNHVMEWKNILKSSDDPARMFDITIGEEDGVPALMIFSEEGVQITGSDIDSTTITDIQQVSLTDDDSIYLKSKQQQLAFTTSRTIQLYKLLFDRIAVKLIENIPKGHTPIYTLSEDYESKINYEAEETSNQDDTDYRARTDSDYSKSSSFSHGYTSMASQYELCQKISSDNTRQFQSSETSSDKDSKKKEEELPYDNGKYPNKDMVQEADYMTMKRVSKPLPTPGEKHEYMNLKMALYDPNEPQKSAGQTSPLYAKLNIKHTERPEIPDEEDQQHINRTQSEIIIIDSTKPKPVIHAKSSGELHGNIEERKSPGSWRVNSTEYKEWVTGKTDNLNSKSEPEDAYYSSIYDVFSKGDDISKLDQKEEASTSTEVSTDSQEEITGLKKRVSQFGEQLFTGKKSDQMFSGMISKSLKKMKGGNERSTVPDISSEEEEPKEPKFNKSARGSVFYVDE